MAINDSREQEYKLALQKIGQGSQQDGIKALINLGLKYIPLGLAGVLFYIAPSFHFITSLFVLGEFMEFEKIIAFILIWIGVAIFIYDVIKKNKLS